MSYFGFVFFTLIIFFNGFTVFLQGNFTASSFVAAYITLPIFGVCWAGWKIFAHTKMVPLSMIDFDSGRRDLDELQERDAEKFKEDTLWKRIVGILF